VGINPGMLDLIASWSDAYDIRPGARVLDIGTSELSCVQDPDSLNRFLAKFGAEQYSPDELLKMANGGFAAGLLRRAGFGYLAIDIADFPDTLRLDLNRRRLPLWHRRRYSLVLNCGTTEHVANQYNAFRVIHDATAVRGVMYHGVPMGDWEHGLIAYTPRFFEALSDANGYERIKMWGWAGDEKPFPWATVEFPQPFTFRAAWLHVLLRRRTRAPFQPPLDHIGQ
jgi:hypothetical protein